MRTSVFGSVGLASLLIATTAFAQPADEAPLSAEPAASASRETTVGEIVVTARKRSESDLTVPISITAFSANELERRGITNLTELGASTPELLISTNAGPFGGSLTLRGVGAGATGSYTVDQAVPINFDGVSATHGAAIRFSQFDLAQVEILKGPQSLYFGKNASAGLISITTADPTRDYYAMVRVGYESVADELITEGVVSGPLIGDLSGRLAVFRSDMDGYFRNPLKPGAVHPTYGVLAGPTFPRTPNIEDIGVRATLKYEPNEALTIRIKASHGQRKGSPSGAQAQLYFCRTGQPQSLGAIPGIGDCTLDRTTLPLAPTSTAAVVGDPRFGDGSLFMRETQSLGIISIDSRINDNLTFNSTSGIYQFDISERSNGSYATAPVLSSIVDNRKIEFSQEFRLSSTFDGPVNFLLGAYLSKSRFDVNAPASFDATASGTPRFPFASAYPDLAIWRTDANTLAGFAQLGWDITEQLELSAGLRYTHEKKEAQLSGLRTGPVSLTRSSRSFDSLSPEVTLSYQPNRDVNFYVSYKGGAKSGGYNVSTLLTLPLDKDYTFDDEKVRGFEGGVKSALLDRRLRFDINAYQYKYSGLQLSTYDPVSAIFTILNAASSKTEGVEVVSRYSPLALPGLTLSGSANYNKARYESYIGPCYVGQSAAAGCNISVPGAAVPSLQDYKGKPLMRAPDWSGSVQADYERALGVMDLGYGVSLAGTYSGDFYPQPEEPPQSLQKSYWLIDGQVRLFRQDDRWELALIGRNLTDTLRIQHGLSATFTPPFNLPPGTGTAVTNYPDLAGYANRPQSVELRLTLKY